MYDTPDPAWTLSTPSSVPMAKIGAADGPQPSSLVVPKEDPATDTEGLSSLDSDSTMDVDHSGSSELEILPQVKETLADLTAQPVTPESPKDAPNEDTSNIAVPMPVLSDEKKTSEDDANLDVPPALKEDKVEEKEGLKSDGKDLTPANPTAEVAAKKESSRSSNSKSRRSRSKRYYDDDASSSDDDSYFAKHLPSPKSGRSFSYDYSSAGSAATGSGNLYQSNAGRESDASLSFSDESDDGMEHQAGVQISPMMPYKGNADMNLYPQRITRMHSVSSLVSSASSDGDNEGSQPVIRSSASSVSSYGTSGTTSDPSVRGEMQYVGAQGRPGSQMTDISGRRSPVMGQHGIPGYFYSSPSPVMSPPPIMQDYAAPQGLSHPAPQPMSHEQIAAWAFNGGPSNIYSTHQQAYGSIGDPPLGGGREGNFRNVEESSNLFHEFAGSNGQAVASFPSQSQSRGNLSNTSRQGQEDQQGRNGNVQDTQNGANSTVEVRTASNTIPSEPRKVLPADERGYKVYQRRWLMLFYMSVLNLLSDWTCYSVAPISLLTEEAFGNIDPERLVVVFLGANAVASISEPVILSRLGLRRTVLFGALLLMIGSIVKSGGVPPILQSDIVEGESAWRLYLGFFLVGLSQPLYQCTPTLLSSSWFPEEERTMATGVALNANQLGIGFAFVFGTLLVANKDDIIPYFGLLSTISTIVFLGALVQFDDAPPTPPSASARVMRGTLDVKLPSINTIVESVREGLTPSGAGGFGSPAFKPNAAAPSPATNESSTKTRSKGSTRRRGTSSRSSAIKDSGLMAPSSAHPGSTATVLAELTRIKAEAEEVASVAPSPMMQGHPDSNENQEQPGEGQHNPYDAGVPPQQPPPGEYPMYPGYPGMPPPGIMPPPYPYPYWDPRLQQQGAPQQPPQQPPQGFYPPPPYYPYQQAAYPPAPHPYYFPHGAYPPPYLAGYDLAGAAFPYVNDIDEGAEPIITITPHHLDIDIKDDQVIRSLKACFARQGFIHALVAFTASGIVINTLSTYMDYLVRLNGAPRAYTGIVGGAFQFIIMISSLIIGKFTDNSRAYYSVTIGMLVLGAFGLAECGVSLDSDRGNDLRWCLVIVAALVGPLQPVSTELGVDVVYPLSENTVLVIQQLFSNLLSALFIPVFKALKDVGSEKIDDTEMFERPEYTFSFYLLIVIHTAATVFFATFNGKYLRYEHELERKADEDEEDERQRQADEAMHPFFRDQGGNFDERQPLVPNPV